MASSMRKMGVYLGLIEDTDRYEDEDFRDGDEVETSGQSSRRPSTEVERPAPVSQLADRRKPTRPSASRPADQQSQVTEMSRITTLHPRNYNEARTIGENFRDGTPVIMNLTEMDDDDAKRLVDFSAGLVFAVHGTIERVTNKVFLLSPPNVTVAAEDKKRIAEDNFFNQS